MIKKIGEDPIFKGIQPRYVVLTMPLFSVNTMRSDRDTKKVSPLFTQLPSPTVDISPDASNRAIYHPLSSPTHISSVITAILINVF